jgi:hypothetical protein
MLPQHAKTLRWQIERSPFSEDIVFVGDTDTWLVDSGGAADVAFECAFINGGSEDVQFEYSLLPLGVGEIGVVVRGIFDESAERDEGNKAFRRKPRVIVFGWPKETRPGTRVVIRGKKYAVASFEADANLGMVVWLR